MANTATTGAGASNSNSTASINTKKRKSPLSKSASDTQASKKASTSQKTGKSKVAAQSREASTALPPEGSRNQSLDPEGGEADDDNEDDEDDDDVNNNNESGAQSSRADSTRPKTGTTSRKAQNRNAQRESRQRKAEYVKALEGYVAFNKFDQDSQLQGLLFAIGWIMEENMKLRSLLGHMANFFNDPTQGTRLPELGISHAELKTMVETNDKMALLDLGEKLRSRIGKLTNENIARQVTLRENLDQKISFRDPAPDAFTSIEALSGSSANNGLGAGNGADSDRLQPIFGPLSAKAEDQLLQNLRQAKVPTATLATLVSPKGSSVPGSAELPAESSTGSSSNQQQQGDPASSDNLAGKNKMEELYSYFARANASAQASGTETNSPLRSTATAAPAPANSSSNSTPIDYNEYIHANHLGGSPNVDLTDYLLGTGINGSLGFQLPDFTSMSSFLQPPQQSTSYNYSMSGSPFGQTQSNQTGHGQAFASAMTGTSQMQYTAGGQTGLGSSSVNVPHAAYVGAPQVSTSTPTTPSTSSLLETSKTLRQQAKHLMKFHLRTALEDASHQLPDSLQPTSAQKVMPHDNRIDSILWPSMRDRLIFSSGQLDLEAVIAALDGQGAVILHATGDLLDPEAWEVTEEFARTYPTLIDGEVLRACNKWRLARGEQPLYL